ncbi:MAG: hypothetical protein GF417_01050, partial [Candidatus Latescibacteria bacterium]|nr:hypothetical protein [bacterium]MBD3423014.1 hypothetical protein [Candidatus Latescibacterota bacterium]
MKEDHRNRIILGLLLLTALSLFLTLPGPLRLISGAVQAFMIPGLVFLFLVGDRKRTWMDSVFFIPVISPVLLTISVLITCLITGDLEFSLKFSTGLFYILLLVCFMSGRFDWGAAASPVPRSVILLSVGYGLLIALSYQINDLLLIRSDAWYHGSVTREILARGIPPMEPWLPDRPIRYMWIYHLFLASWKELSGLSLFRSMIALNLISAFSFPYLMGRISSFFTTDRKRIFLVSLIALAGLESASWIGWPLVFMRVFSGEVSGMEEVRRIISELSFTGPGMIHTLAPFPTYMVN